MCIRLATESLLKNNKRGFRGIERTGIAHLLGNRGRRCKSKGAKNVNGTDRHLLGTLALLCFLFLAQRLPQPLLFGCLPHPLLLQQPLPSSLFPLSLLAKDLADALLFKSPPLLLPLQLE